MGFYYSATASATSAAGAATQTLHARTTTGATRQAAISRLLCGAKGAAQDNQVLFQAWKPTTVATVGGVQAAAVHADGAPAAATVFATTPTVGVKGAFPTIQLPFNSRAMVQWVALNPDEALSLAAGGVAAGDMNFYNEQAAGVAVVIPYQATWYEG